MIKMTYEHINRHQVENALRKLMNSPLNNLRTSYNVHKIGEEILRAVAEKRVEYTMALRELAEKDEKGQVLFHEDGSPKIPASAQEKVVEATQRVLAGEITIERHRVPTLELMAAKLSPNEVAALEPMLSGLDEVETA